MGQQVDAARHTAEAARHIREVPPARQPACRFGPLRPASDRHSDRASAVLQMTELARSQIAQALDVPSTPSASLPGQQREPRLQHPAATKSPPPRPASDR